VPVVHHTSFPACNHGQRGKGQADQGARTGPCVPQRAAPSLLFSSCDTGHTSLADDPLCSIAHNQTDFQLPGSQSVASCVCSWHRRSRTGGMARHALAVRCCSPCLSATCPLLAVCTSCVAALNPRASRLARLLPPPPPPLLLLLPQLLPLKDIVAC